MDMTSKMSTIRSHSLRTTVLNRLVRHGELLANEGALNPGARQVSGVTPRRPLKT
jgi:hypothetical protein